MAPPKTQGKPISFLCVFCIVVCINVAVLIYLSVNLVENQTQFEILKRTGELRHLQLLEDQELQQYRRMEMIQSVHYRKTKDQRIQDQYNVYTEKYLDMQRLGEWILNLQNKNNVEDVQDQSILYQAEQDLKVLTAKDIDRNMQDGVLTIQDEREQTLKLQDQDLNIQAQKEMYQKVQGLKEKDDKEQTMNIYDVKKQDLNLQDQSMHEVQNLKVQQSKEREDKNVQGEENQYIQARSEGGINVQDQGTQHINVENNEKLEKKETDQKEGITIIQIRDEHDKEKKTQDNKNERDFKTEGVIVQEQKGDNQDVQYLEEYLEDLKKQEQYEKKLEFKVQPQTEDVRDIIQDPNLRQTNGDSGMATPWKTQGKQDETNAEDWKNNQDLKDEQELQIEKQKIQEQMIQEFQNQHQLLEEYLKSKFGIDINDQMLDGLNGQDTKILSQIMMQAHTEIADQAKDEVWSQHWGSQDQNVKDLQSPEVKEMDTVPSVEVSSRKIIDNSHGSEEEVRTKTAIDDESHDPKTSSPSAD